MKWYEIKCKENGDAEIWLYDEIGLWGIGAKEFIAELNAIKAKKIELHINSPGGDVFDGNAIYNAVKRHPAEVTSFIDGLAASIASVIALAGKKVVMAENALYMMHNPSGLVIGEAEDMRKMADLLDKVRDSILGAYAEKSGKTAEEIKALMDAETWFDADEALEAGFVDSVGEPLEAAACSKFLPSMTRMGYKHIPAAKFNPAKKTPSERDLERVLRDAGCSAKEAKKILARGYGDSPRDADPPDPGNSPTRQRDAGAGKNAGKDRVNDLLIRAELVAPKQS